jgi:hypothetical protein
MAARLRGVWCWLCHLDFLKVVATG